MKNFLYIITFLILTIINFAQWEPDRKLSTNVASATPNENMGRGDNWEQDIDRT